MELYGGLTENLKAALESAKRHEGHPVRAETIKFWSDLLLHARRLRAEGNQEAWAVDPLLAELDLAISERSSK